MADQRETFLTTELPRKILQDTKDLDGDGCITEVKLTKSNHLDGFMSMIHKLSFRYESKDGSDKRTLNLIVKLMQGSEKFREESFATIQSLNEIYIYTKVLPVFHRLLADADCGLTADWCPKVFFGASGHFASYSDQYESILVLEDISPFGYVAGPRLHLEEDHLRLMIRNIATFHACTYAMHIRKDPRLQTLIDGIVPLDFLSGDEKFKSYDVLFKLGIDRVYRYLDTHPEQLVPEDFKATFERFRNTYGETPIELMQHLLKRDKVFSVIVHGDYNRNNVLFRMDADGKPVALKMFDFQETRYATPVIDLTFFMYMSMTQELRERCWDQLIEEYHRTLFQSLASILKVNGNDPTLDPYRFDAFMDHFKQHALYGVIVTLHFLPWMICPEDECEQLSYHFARDVNSPEMAHWSRVCGGEEVDKQLVDILRHASRKGYYVKA